MKHRNGVVVMVLLLTVLAVSAYATGAVGSGTGVADVETLPPTLDVAAVKALQENPDVVLLDVREPSEYAAGHIPGIRLIPMGEVPNRLDEIPRDKTVIVTCRTGNRSEQIANFLREQGYTNVHNMEGGIVEWEQAGYPVEK